MTDSFDATQTPGEAPVRPGREPLAEVGAEAPAEPLSEDPGTCCPWPGGKPHSEPCDRCGTCCAYQNTAVAKGNYKVNPCDAPSHICDADSTQVDCIRVRLTKKADKCNVLPGWIVTYTITFVNQSSVPLCGVKIADTIPPQTTLVPGSVVPMPQPGESLTTGVTVGNVAPGACKTLIFQAKVSHFAVGSIKDIASACYKFRDWKGVEHTGSAGPACATVRVVRVNLCVCKSADQTYVTGPCDEVTYTLLIKNGGTVPICNITVTDPVPAGMIYKANSTLRNGTLPYTNENPACGIPIGTLEAGACYKLQFTFKVV